MSISNVDLERQLKAVTKTGKFVVGRKEVLHGLKGTKLLVWSGSAGISPHILLESKNLSIPSIRFEGSPIELGKACGIPYKVSIFAVKSTGDAVISQFEASKDYGAEQGEGLMPVPKVKSLARNGKEIQTSSKQRKTSKKEEKGEAIGEKSEAETTKRKKRVDTKTKEEYGSSKIRDAKSTTAKLKKGKGKKEVESLQAEENKSAEEESED